MCPHVHTAVIKEGMVEEGWEEGDLYVKNTYDWVVCNDCGDDFACKAG